MRIPLLTPGPFVLPSLPMLRTATAIDRQSRCRRASRSDLQGTYTNLSLLGTSLDGERSPLASFAPPSGAAWLAMALPINPGADLAPSWERGVAAHRTSRCASTSGSRTGTNAIRKQPCQSILRGGRRIKVPITPRSLSSVDASRRHFGHFNNIEATGPGCTSAPRVSRALIGLFGRDAGNNNSPRSSEQSACRVLVQPDPHFALTLLAGYSGIGLSSGAGSQSLVLHYVPIGWNSRHSAPILTSGRLMIDDISRRRWE